MPNSSLTIRLAAIALLCIASQSAGAADEGFALQDFLGRTWRRECVSFPIGAKTPGGALLDPKGRAVAYQVTPAAANAPARISFLADLDPFETRVYRFGQTAGTPRTDLKIEQTPEHIRITNGRIGLSIARQLSRGTGPVLAIRTASGKWVGGSSAATGPPQKYEARILASGPVFVEVACEAQFAGGRIWRMRFRMQAGEPAIVVDESFACVKDTSWALHLKRGFPADHILFRYGKSGADGRCGKTATWKIAPGAGEPAFVLEPWLRWWERTRQGNWFGVYASGGKDLLAIGALNAATWVDPAVKSADRSPAKLLLSEGKSDLKLTFPLGGGRRRWMISALDTASCLAPITQDKPYQAPLPQQYLIKHGDIPLDRVKDYVLDWKGDHDNYPRLYVTKKDLARMRKTFKPDPKKLEQYRKATINYHNMGGPITYYLATGDEALGRHLGATAVRGLQAAVDMYLKQTSLVTQGFAPHHQTRVLTSIILADSVLGATDKVLSADLRGRMRGQIAFLGYTVNRADYWSPRRGFSANPNMTTTVAAYQCAAACIIPSHPQAKTWIRGAMSELKDNQLDRWSDAAGGWLEAPHYAMVSYDYLVGCFLMARNAGFADHLYDPRMKKVAEWFAMISTPPDSRLANLRHMPCIGNTYVCEPTGEFGVIAGLWKDKDPRFAAEMQWMHLQHGSRATPGVGGFFPTLAGYRAALSDETITPRQPAYTSQLFPKTGLVLRNKYPCDRETYLHMIAGTNHDHYDRDSGSILLYGKGRLLVNDFGYYGHVTGKDHNMLMSPAARDSETMSISQFAASGTLDYVRGVKRAWTRQIAFVKDADVLGPNYFVLRDSLSPPDDATWRLYCTAAKVTVKGPNVLVAGKEDVDMDIIFIRPGRVDIKTRTISRSTWGLNDKVRYGRVTTTQRGLIAALSKGQNVTAVLYPRLKSDKPPTVTALADGNGVKVHTAWGTDYVFLSRKAMKFSQGDISFEGTIGAAAVRGKKLTLSLGAAGSISAGGETLKSDRPASKQWPAISP